MQRKKVTTSKRTRDARKKLDESLPPKGERFTKVTSAVFGGRYFVVENGEWIEVKEEK